MRFAGKALTIVLVGCTLLLARPFAQSKPAADDASSTPPAPPIRVPLTKLTPEASIAVAGDRDLVASGDAMWILNRTSPALLKIDPKTNAVASPVTLTST